MDYITFTDLVNQKVAGKYINDKFDIAYAVRDAAVEVLAPALRTYFEFDEEQMKKFYITSRDVKNLLSVELDTSAKGKKVLFWLQLNTEFLADVSLRRVSIAYGNAKVDYHEGIENKRIKSVELGEMIFSTEEINNTKEKYPDLDINSIEFCMLAALEYAIIHQRLLNKENNRAIDILNYIKKEYGVDSAQARRIAKQVSETYGV